LLTGQRACDIEVEILPKLQEGGDVWAYPILQIALAAFQAWPDRGPVSQV
jgi:hypothetical protein